MRAWILVVAGLAAFGPGSAPAADSPVFAVAYCQRYHHALVEDGPTENKVFGGTGRWSGSDAHAESAFGSSFGSMDQDTTITVGADGVDAAGRMELRLLNATREELWGGVSVVFTGADAYSWSCAHAETGIFIGGSPFAQGLIYDITDPRRYVLVADFPMNGSASGALDPTRSYQFSVFLQLYNGATADKSFTTDFAFRAALTGGIAPAAVSATLAALAAEPSSSFANEGNRTALENFLEQALAFLEDEKTDQAKSKVLEAMERCDGWALRGAADGAGHGFEMDYVTDRLAALDAYDRLSAALAALGG